MADATNDSKKRKETFRLLWKFGEKRVRNGDTQRWGKRERKSRTNKTRERISKAIICNSAKEKTNSK